MLQRCRRTIATAVAISAMTNSCVCRAVHTIHMSRRWNSHSTSSNPVPTNPTAVQAGYQPLINPEEVIAPPPAKGRAVPNTFSMQVLFLGYGVGKFELEMLHGCPQLSRDTSTGRLAAAEEFHFTPEQLQDSSSRFDLSAHPMTQRQTAGTDADSSNLRSSWASSRESQASLAHRSQPDPKFSNQMQFGGREPTQQQDPLAGLNFPQTQPQRFDPSNSTTGERSAAAMPPNNRIIVHSSVVVYQNVMFCWSPNTFSDVTVDSLSFLRTLTPRPELILLGTGSEISHRLTEDVTEFLKHLNIGIELMDSGNAIGTYNILTDEGRTVLAAMIKKPAPKPRPFKETRSMQMRKKLGYWNE